MYKLDTINRVSVHTLKPSYSIKNLGIIRFLLFGMLVSYGGIAFNDEKIKLIGVLLFFIGIGGIVERFIRKNKYALKLTFNFGGESLVGSQEKDFIEKIVNKIYEFMNNPDPRNSYVFNMEDRSITVGGDSIGGYFKTGDSY